MAGRPTKQGLEYFPLDVDFFNDEKVEFVSARFGIKGEIIAVRLLCKIYRIGYYTEWNEDESTLLAKRAGDAISPALVNDVVRELVKRGFFDETLLDTFNILTSKGIQRRYVRATSDRKEVEIDRNYWLVDLPKNAISVNLSAINSISPPINSEKPPVNSQSRVKESKVKESKREAAIAATRTREKEFYDSLRPYVEQYGKDMIRDFYNYWTEKTKSGTKMRFEQQSTWETPKRLATWARKESDYKRQTPEEPTKKPKFL